VQCASSERLTGKFNEENFLLNSRNNNFVFVNSLQESKFSAQYFLANGLLLFKAFFVIGKH
jgi:hypothetical protein